MPETPQLAPLDVEETNFGCLWDLVLLVMTQKFMTIFYYIENSNIVITLTDWNNEAS